MDSRHLNFPKSHEFDCLNFEENPFGKDLELSSFGMESVYDFNNCNFYSLVLPCQSTDCTEFNDFEDICNDFAFLDDQNITLPSMHEDIMVDAKPLKTIHGSIGQYYDNYHNTTNGGSSMINEPLNMMEREYAASSEHREQRRISGRKRTVPLELDEIQKHFDYPISEAAKEMNVGLTLLKKRCRELNIMRWPHRKIKSLKSLINNVKETGLTDEIVTLEEHKRLLEELPDTELTERTKKLRQACFKANYKKRISQIAPCY